MRYRYLDDFPRGISVFAIFSYGIAVLGNTNVPLHECSGFRAQFYSPRSEFIYDIIEISQTLK